MLKRILVGAFLSGTLFVSALAGGIDGGASAKKVKVRASATKPDDKGNQVVTVNVSIDPGWHLYANPVEHNKETFNRNKTNLSFSSKVKLAAIKIEYPPGKLLKDGEDQYKIYEGDVTMRAIVKRFRGDTSPLEWTLDVSACNKDTCLPRGSITFKVP
jgi:DsbC/DsbD-like thiol-disulfide interchange protein